MHYTLTAKDRVLSKVADRLHLLDGLEVAGHDSDEPVTFHMVGHDGGTAGHPHTPLVVMLDEHGVEVMRFSLSVEVTE